MVIIVKTTDLIFEWLVVYLISRSLFLTGIALNSILIDERLGFARKSFGRAPQFAIILPSTPTLKSTLNQIGYEVRFPKSYDGSILSYDN